MNFTSSAFDKPGFHKHFSERLINLRQAQSRWHKLERFLFISDFTTASSSTFQFKKHKISNYKTLKRD